MNIVTSINNLPLKDMDGTLLVFSIINEVNDEDKVVISDACMLASYLHRNTPRKGRGMMPVDYYITHPLRNTLRLIRLGVLDVNVLVASILHDTVEDCSKEILALAGVSCEGLNFDELVAAALRILAGRYNETVATLLAGVTNPEMPKHLAWQEKHKLYRAHVLAVIPDELVFLIKVSDIMDNAGSLHHTAKEHPDMCRKLAHKYLPLIPALLERLEETTVFEAFAKGTVKQQLLKIQKRLTELL